MKILADQQHDCFSPEEQMNQAEDLRWLFWGAVSSAGISILAWVGIAWLVMSWF